MTWCFSASIWKGPSKIYDIDIYFASAWLCPSTLRLFASKLQAQSWLCPQSTLTICSIVMFAVASFAYLGLVFGGFEVGPSKMILKNCCCVQCASALSIHWGCLERSARAVQLFRYLVVVETHT